MIRETIAVTTSRARRFLSAEVQGLQAAAYILAASAFLSSLLALVRDRLLAHNFGASGTLDVYYAGFRIPDLVFVATAALVSVYILIPELSKRDADGQKRYIDNILAGFSLFAVIVAGISAYVAPSILARLFPSFSPDAMEQLVTITRILLLQPILLGFSNIFAAVTQSRHRYLLYSLSPLLYNIAIIIGIEFLYPSWGIPGVAAAVVFGALLHAGIQVPSLLRDGFLSRLPRVREPLTLLRTGALSIPRALALSMSQVTLIGLTTLAAGLSTGSIAVFMFAFNLQAVPLAVIGASFSVAAFPTLSAAFSMGNREEFVRHVVTAARYVIAWSIPAGMLILVLRAYLVRVILGTGAFDWTDTRLTAAAFGLFSLSLAAQGVQLLLVRGYYAAGRTLVPFLIAFGTMLTTLAIAALSLFTLQDQALMHSVEVLLRVEDVPGSDIVALAFAYTVAAILGAFVLAAHFQYSFGGFLQGVYRTFFESVAAGFLGGISAYLTLSIFNPLVPTTATVSVFLLGLGGGIAGILATILGYAILGTKEYLETMIALRARLWRKEKPSDVPVVSSAES